MDTIASPSPNFNDRRLSDTQTGPDMLILHYTDTQTAFEALSLLQSPEREVSAHYLVDEDGTIYSLVDEDKRAWHAGLSHWDGEEDINSLSIGIEIQNPGHGNGYRAFPEKQMQAVKDLCLDILSRHDIPPHRILGHSDIAPGRKQDPGELFDWEYLAQHGIGLWPHVTEEDQNNASNLTPEDGSLTAAFKHFGYNTDAPFQEAFTQHFKRETTKKNSDAEMICSLNRIKKTYTP